MESHDREGSIIPFIIFGLPGAAAALAPLALERLTPDSAFWRLADQLQWAFLISPITLLAAAVYFFRFPLRRPIARVLAVVMMLPTVFLLWRVVLWFVYFSGLGSFPNA